MGDAAHHSRLAREKRAGARREYAAGRYSNVGDLAFKAVEQAIEAAAAKLADRHFHVTPRTAHQARRQWLQAAYSALATDFDIVWGAYGDLGYEGIDGRRAREALKTMEHILDELGHRAGLRLT